MSNFVDRRLDGKNKSAVNRQRFIRRFKKQLKQAVGEVMGRRSVTDMDRGESVTIPSRDLSEPSFKHGPGGRKTHVHSGNKEFITGDKVPRPQGGGGGGAGNGDASNSGQGEDDFVFQLSREEFLDLFFEDMELPNLTKRQLAQVVEYTSVNAGITSDGTPAKMHVIRSLMTAQARRNAMSATARKEMKELEQALETLAEDDESRAKLLAQIEVLQQKIKRVPWIDETDLRYRNHTRQPKPTTRAVMFCIMDVSGSMSQERKDLAKRFFILLHLFLRRNYKHVDVVFVRHHTVAKEVDEEEFFYSRETGGTVVSSSLELVHEIVKDRYPSDTWNVYVAQASDGDNWKHDSPLCRDILINRIMPLVQYFAYIEITPDRHQSLWEAYEEVAAEYTNFAMEQIDGPSDIYPVFRELFRKQSKGVAA